MSQLPLTLLQAANQAAPLVQGAARAPAPTGPAGLPWRLPRAAAAPCVRPPPTPAPLLSCASGASASAAPELAGQTPAWSRQRRPAAGQPPASPQLQRHSLPASPAALGGPQLLLQMRQRLLRLPDLPLPAGDAPSAAHGLPLTPRLRAPWPTQLPVGGEQALWAMS